MRKKISGAGAAAATFTSFFSDFMTAIMQFLFRRRRQSVTSVSFSFKRADKSKVNPYCWKMSSHFLFTTSKEIEKLKVLQRQKQCKNWLGETPSCVSTAQSFLLMCHFQFMIFFILCSMPFPKSWSWNASDFQINFALHVLQCCFFFSHCSEMRSVPMCIFVKRVIHFGCCEVLLRPFSSVEALPPWIIWISAGGDEARATF